MYRSHRSGGSTMWESASIPLYPLYIRPLFREIPLRWQLIQGRLRSLGDQDLLRHVANVVIYDPDALERGRHADGADDPLVLDVDLDDFLAHLETLFNRVALGALPQL